MNPHAKWALIVGALVVHNLTTEHEFSKTVRKVYRTETRLGKVLLVASWAGFSAWLMPHWCRIPLTLTEEEK